LTAASGRRGTAALARRGRASRTTARSSPLAGGRVRRGGAAPRVGVAQRRGARQGVGARDAGAPAAAVAARYSQSSARGRGSALPCPSGRQLFCRGARDDRGATRPAARGSALFGAV